MAVRFTLLMFCLLLSLSGCTPSTSTSADEAVRPSGPNVVLIISDDQRWDDFGFMGHDVIETPHLDRLAAESAVFPNGYVPSSLCRPSLATMVTGLYPHQHGITSNDPPPGVDRAEMVQFIARAPAVPRLLRQHGYRSLQTGKWWEGHYATGGFTDGMTINGEGGRHGDRGLAIGREGLQPVFDFIEAGTAPFFVWYAPFLPHTPHTPPERLLERYRAEGRPEALARYYAMCTWFDETVGELLAYLDDQGLRDETIVLFAIDNGWIQNVDWAPGMRGVQPFAPKSKRSPYDGGLRTPIMVRWPGHLEPGVRGALASTIDLAPTMLGAAGVPVPGAMPGVDLVGLARGDIQREAVYGEVFSHDAVDLDRPAASLQYRWVREENWKLIAAVDGGVELYDLAADPDEEVNLAGDRPDVVRRLRGHLDAWWRPEIR